MKLSKSRRREHRSIREEKQTQRIGSAVVAALAKQAKQFQNEAVTSARGNDESRATAVHHERPLCFTKFMQLPAELRMVIWEMALPGRRIFEPFIEYIDWEDRVLTLLHPHAPPAIRGVCRESWKVTEEHGIWCFGKHQNIFTRNEFWFNPEIDIVYLAPIKVNRGSGVEIVDPDEEFEIVHYLQWTGFDQIQHLALTWNFIAANSLSAVFPKENIKSLTVVYEAGKLQPPSIRQRPVAFRFQDQEIVNSSDQRTWADCIQKILKKWQRLEPNKSYRRVEGVEIFRRKPNQEDGGVKGRNAL